jgi:hypothetical protein
MTIMPHGENLRKAVQWISEQRQEAAPKSMAKIIEEASLTFNLTPAEALYLEHWISSDGKDDTP